jgi:hypothetical protein
MRALPLLVVLSFSGAAVAETPLCSSDDTVCLPETDFEQFVAIAAERRCLETTKPKFEIDNVVVITDLDGRVFYTGADPKRPYKLKMNWCQYEVVAEGKIEVVAAMQEPDTWGFRFRPKAYLGYLPTRLLSTDSTLSSGIDAGLLLDFFYVEWASLNAAVGFRSVGFDLGVDLTDNFGGYAGYGLGWTQPLHNVSAGVYFAF